MDFNTNGYDDWDTTCDGDQFIGLIYTTTATGSADNFIDFEEVRRQKILESREQLKWMWLDSLKQKCVLYQISLLITIQNRKVLRCNRKGIGLRLRAK
jgi:hypothetical protein